MAKAKKEKSTGAKKNFEERLDRLEELGEEIRKNDTPLDDAIRAFEEGVKLARALEKDLDKIESRIEILMNGGDAPSEDGSEETVEEAELELFDDEE